jgi:cytochrome b subunit of formate dehydrogenase/nitrate/TMAO reductase-like tetraheme cytochrome c subunit
MAAGAGWGQAVGDAACASCHEQSKKLTGSVHLAMGCQGCHSEHEKYPHPKNVEKPACATCHSEQAGAYERGVHGQARKRGNAAAPDCAICHGDAHEMKAAGSNEFRKAVPETCGMCHTDISQQYLASVHGKAIARGVNDAPLCTDCHGEHSILSHKDAKSPVSSRQIRETCARCHGDVRLSRKFGLPADRIVSFDSSFHGLASKSGSQSVANCGSCHGIHNILPSTDAKSTTNAKNLPVTCGKCHPGAGSRFALGTIHSVEGGKEPAGVKMAREFYLLVIPLTIGFMFLHHFGDWMRKVIGLRFRAAAIQRESAAESYLSLHRREFRMHAFERVQHGLLVVSFGVLVWTGFALKYPGEWWARPLVMWESSWPVRGVVHRVAAAAMIVVSLAHVVSLIASRRLRDHWKTLMPRPRDATEALLNFAYNMGLRTTRPSLSAHGYVEKAEYWAVVWGTGVMALTGLVLWANNLALQYLPKSWLDFAVTVHFYEAVLATLAILVWHLYTVIFDPDVYPMDTAWLTGFSVRKREHHDLEAAGESSTSPAQEKADEHGDSKSS